jgi:hypothetical protein
MEKHPVGASGNYEYSIKVNPKAKMMCSRTGIYKEFGKLSDADIELMIAKGNTDFTEKKPSAPIVKKSK